MSGSRSYSHSRSGSETNNSLSSVAHTAATSVLSDDDTLNDNNDTGHQHATETDGPDDVMTYSDPEDIFSSSTPPSHSVTTPSSSPPRHHGSEALLSELPAVRRQHVNSGFREGISSSKTVYVQQGFDDGFPVGGGLGLRVGALKGVLEGFMGALAPDGEEYRDMRGLCEDMMADLDVANLFAKAQKGAKEGTDAREFPAVLKMSANEVVEKWEALVGDMLNHP